MSASAHDHPVRAYLTCRSSGPSTAPVVARVLREAADTLDRLGEVDVSDINLTSAVHTHDETVVTVYFDSMDADWS